MSSQSTITEASLNDGRPTITVAAGPREGDTKLQLLGRIADGLNRSTGIVNVTASLTLLPEHNGKVLVVESGAATVITWNDDSNALPVGFNCTVIKNTSESVSFAIVGDVTLSSINDNVTMENLNGAVTFLTVSATLGFIFGDLYTP